MGQSSSSAEPGSLIPDPSVKSKFHVNNHYPRIARVGSALAWIETDINKLELMDRNGSTKEAFKTAFLFTDFTVASDGCIIIADWSHNSIKSVDMSAAKNISNLFNTSGKPFGLCCLDNDDIVVALCDEKKVNVYGRDGEMKRTFDHIEFKHPMKVAVNMLNQDIYIIDHEEDDYSSTGKLIALGADGQLRYEYTGHGDKVFNPVEMCTDPMGHILITDYNNHEVHVLDKVGQHVMTLHKGLQCPNTIDADMDGYVWVGERVGPGKGRVKVFKYLHL